MTQGFRQFLTTRVVVGVGLGVVALWALSLLLGYFEQPDEFSVTEVERSEPLHGLEHVEETKHVAGPVEVSPHGGIASHKAPHGEEGAPMAPGHAQGDEGVDKGVDRADEGHGGPDLGVRQGTVEPLREPEAVAARKTTRKHLARGVAFVDATVKALDYELNQRFWGWRRNDIIRVTDNVENMQLGVLEVVRRSSVSLAERISRHGMSDIIDENLENAMNWLMIKPDRYWLPSAEEKYNDSLDELRDYAKRLEMGEARFYVRADNLIPLLLSFADLVGSCDENLVKEKEEDGSPVSWSRTDDYFFYAKGVATAMGMILHAVREDFSSVLEARHGVDLLHHAIHACEVASRLDPWLVTDASLDGILANHRANMAAPISHARYFLDQLAKALST